jgi:hypothetical protein
VPLPQVDDSGWAQSKLKFCQVPAFVREHGGRSRQQMRRKEACPQATEERPPKGGLVAVG